MASSDIDSTYLKVGDDKDETGWMIVAPPDGASKTFSLQSSGTGGLKELVENFDEGQVQFGYVRVEYANDKESSRVKYVFVKWIGESASVMKKAKASMLAGDLQKKINIYSREITTGDKGDLNEDAVVKLLRAAGGADYNGGRG